MSDDTSSKPDTIPAPPPSESGATINIQPLSTGGFSAPEIGAPLASWVKGGTTSLKFDTQVKKDEAEAEHRRDIQDLERKVCSVPVEEGGGKMYNHHFAHPTDDPKVLIYFCNAPSDVEGIPLLCDILVEHDGSSMSLNMICPKCHARGIPSGQCQFRVNDKHRKWHLDTRTRGEIIRFGEEIYVSAGTIMDSETIRCPHFNCNLKVKIHKNIMYPV